MSVFLTDDEIKTFGNNGFSENDLQETINAYRADGLDDNAIRGKIDQRLNSWKTPQPQEQPIAQSKPIEQPQEQPITPITNDNNNYSFNLGVEENVYNHDKSKWHDTLRQAGRNTARFLLPKGLENKFIGSKEDEKFLSKYNDSNVPTFEQINNDYKAGKINKKQMLEFGQLRGKLDELRADAEYRDYRNKEYGKEALLLGSSLGGGAGLAAKGVGGLIGGAALGGAGYGLGKSIIDEELNPLTETAKEAALWGGTAGVLGKGGKALAETSVGQKVLQKGGELLNKGFEKIASTKNGQKILNELGKERHILRPKAGEPAKVNADKIQQLDEIKGLRQDNQRALSEELARIEQEYQAELQNVSFTNPKAGIDKYYKNLIKDTKRQYNNVDKSLQEEARKLDKGSFKGYLRDLKEDIKKNQFEKKDLQVITGAGKNGVWKQTLQNEDNAIVLAEREFNNIIDEISKNPQRVNDAPFLNNVEARIQKIIDDSPYPNEAEFVNSFWNRYTKAIDDAYNYNKFKFGTNKNNYFGGETPPEWFNKFADGERKTSKLPQSMKKAGTLPKELENIKPEYEVLHNADIANEATKALNENPSAVLGELQTKASGKEELSALDFEKARQTLSKLYQEGRIDEALVLSDMISKKASQAGQSVQALSMWSRTTPEGAIRQAQKIISDYNKTAKKKLELTEEQAKKIMDLATNAQATELGTRENEIATQLLMKELKNLIPASIGQKLRTWQNISLLLNPVTIERNVIGNSLFGGLENTATKSLAAFYDKLASIKTGQRTRVLPQLKQYGQGLKQGFKEGVEDVKLGINTRDKLGTRFNLNDRTSFDDIPVLNQLEKALNFSLQAPDRMFYQAAYNESMANQLAATGLKEATPEMIQNATNEALEAVFQNNSKLGNAVVQARQALNNLGNINGYGVGDAFIPYAQTPANLAVQGWNYSPLGFTNAIKNVRAGNQRQATLDAARATIGTGLGALGFEGARRGIINPAIEDARERENYKALGIRPSTVNIGDYNVSINQLQPMAQPLMSGAAIGSAMQGDYMGALDKGLGSLTDLGMLQSLTNFMSDFKQSGPATAAANIIGNIPSRFVPTVLRQATDLTDNIQRDTYDKNPFKYGYNQAIAKIPGLNKTLPAKYDVTGLPMEKRQTKGSARTADILFNPLFVNKRKDDLTTQKLIDLYETTGDKSVLLPVVDKTVRFKDLQGNQIVRPLNTKEKNQYQEQIGTLNKQLLDNIVNTPFYDNLDDEDKINLVTATQRYTKSYVDENLWGKPNAQKRALVRKLLKTPKDKIINDIMKIYKNDVLPAKTKQIYDANFR